MDIPILYKKISYFVCLTFFLLYVYMKITLFSNNEIYKFSLICLYVSLLGFLIKIFILDKQTGKEFVRNIIFILLSFIIYIHSSYMEPFIVCVYILAAKNISFRSIIKWAFVFGTIYLILIIFLSQLGIVTDLVYSRGVGTRARHALGTAYPTIVSMRFFYLVMYYLYLKKFKLRIHNYLIIFLLNILVYYYTDTRLDSYIIFIVLLVVLFYKNIVNILKSKFGYITVSIPVSLFFVTMYLSFNYNPNSLFYYNLNDILSSRLYYGNLAFKLYTPEFFGKEIYLQGLGGLQGYNNFLNTYFFLDSGFLVSVFEYGTLFTFVTMLIITMAMFKWKKNENYNLIICTIIMSVYAMISGSIFSSTNFFIVGLIAILDSKDKRRKYKNQNLDINLDKPI